MPQGLIRPFLWGWVVLTGCKSRPPAAPADAPSDAGVTLTTPAWRPPQLAVESASDLIVPTGVSIVRGNVYGYGDCSDDTCVLAHVQPDERLRLESETAQAVVVRTLPLPVATPLEPGQPVRLPMVPVTPDDPRGAFVDTTFGLDQPARVTLDWATLHDSPSHGAPHFVGLSLYGPTGPLHAAVSTQTADPTHFQRTFELPAGAYTARFTENIDHHSIVCTGFERPDGRITTPPDWCDLPRDAGPFDLRVAWLQTDPPESNPAPNPPAPPADITLRNGENRLRVDVEPPPASHTFAVRPGDDVVATWTPAEVPMGFAWKVSEDHWARGACEDAACRFHAVPFDAVTLILPSGDTDRTANVALHMLPRPEPQFTLKPGFIADTYVSWPSAHDPRGPMLDFEIELPGPGRYRVGTAWTDGDDVPHIVLLDRDEHIVDTLVQSMSADPYNLKVYEVDAAGTYTIRVHTCPTCPEQSLKVELQHE